MYSLRSCSVNDGLFLVLGDPFHSFQLRRYLRSLTLHAVKLRLLDMIAPRQQVEHLLAGVADVPQQLVLVRGQIPFRTSERVYTGGTQPIRTAFSSHTKILCAHGATNQIMCHGVSDSNICCILVSNNPPKCPSCVCADPWQPSIQPGSLSDD